MKDAFGREIKVGDTLIYGTRSGSSQDLNVAIVKEIVKKSQKWTDTEKEFIRADCIASTGFDFTHGRSKWTGTTYETERITSRSVSLHASGNMMIANGLNLEEFRALVATNQEQNIAEAAARRQEHEKTKAGT